MRFDHTEEQVRCLLVVQGVEREKEEETCEGDQRDPPDPPRTGLAVVNAEPNHSKPSVLPNSECVSSLNDLCRPDLDSQFTATVDRAGRIQKRNKILKLIIQLVTVRDGGCQSTGRMSSVCQRVARPAPHHSYMGLRCYSLALIQTYGLILPPIAPCCPNSSNEWLGSELRGRLGGLARVGGYYFSCS